MNAPGGRAAGRLAGADAQGHREVVAAGAVVRGAARAGIAVGGRLADARRSVAAVVGGARLPVVAGQHVGTVDAALSGGAGVVGARILVVAGQLPGPFAAPTVAAVLERARVSVIAGSAGRRVADHALSRVADHVLAGAACFRERAVGGSRALVCWRGQLGGADVVSLAIGGGRRKDRAQLRSLGVAGRPRWVVAGPQRDGEGQRHPRGCPQQSKSAHRLLRRSARRPCPPTRVYTGPGSIPRLVHVAVGASRALD